MNSTQKLNYQTYSVLLRHRGFIEVVACSYEAMLADINEAFCNVEVITWSVR